ncbi:MAG: hypothetical protein Q8M65_07975 [Rhodoglobus sp.]|nr:hypothetical protein [Rhodoglobus sp.]
MATDPTNIRSQPALTTSSGRSWLLVGGLFSAISLGVLIPMTQLPPPGVALVGAIAVAALYLGMIGVQLVLPAGRRRLGVLAVGMLAIALIALVAVGIVAAIAATAATG